MKSVKPALVLSALVVWMAVLHGRGEGPRQEPRKLDDALAQELGNLMQRKLRHAQAVLEGIALSDFDQIARHAEQLLCVGRQAEWQVLQTTRYELHSLEFRRSAEDLVRKAKEKNLDGATMAYVALTLACVNCHQHVRDVRSARLDPTAPPVGSRTGR